MSFNTKFPCYKSNAFGYPKVIFNNYLQSSSFSQTSYGGYVTDYGPIVYKTNIGGLDKTKIFDIALAVKDGGWGDYLFRVDVGSSYYSSSPNNPGSSYWITSFAQKARASNTPLSQSIQYNAPCVFDSGSFNQNQDVWEGYHATPALLSGGSYWAGLGISTNIPGSNPIFIPYNTPSDQIYQFFDLKGLNKVYLNNLLVGLTGFTPPDAEITFTFYRTASVEGNFYAEHYHGYTDYSYGVAVTYRYSQTSNESFSQTFSGFFDVYLALNYQDEISANYANKNFPNVSNVNIKNSNNTTSANIIVGKNAYFEKDNLYAPATDIYFSKPTNRKQGLTEFGEWTKAKAAWFESSGEWVQFWPSATSSTKKFFKPDFSTIGIQGAIEVVKVIPEYPTLWMLLSVTPENTLDSTSIIAKINLESGKLEKYVTPQFPANNSGYISDIFVTNDAVYAAGYIAPTTQNGPLAATMSVNNRVAAKSNYDDNLGLTTLTNDNMLLDPVENITPIFKRYTKQLSLAFSRKIGNGSPANTCYGKSLGYLKKHIDLAEDGEGSSVIVSASRKYEPRISVFNNNVYVYIPFSKNIGDEDFFVKQLQYDNPTYPELNIEQGIYCKKFKLNGDIVDTTTKEVCSFGETALYSETGYKVNFFKGFTRTILSGGRGFFSIDLPAFKDTNSAYRNFSKVYSSSCVSADGTPSVTIYADPNLNGNNRIIFGDTFSYRSYQINPQFNSAFLSADQNFSYVVFTGDIDSNSNANEMFIGMYSKTDTFEIDCAFENQLEKTGATLPTFLDLNQSLTKDFGTWPNASGYSPTVTSFFVTETVNDNSSTGWDLTQVCNA